MHSSIEFFKGSIVQFSHTHDGHLQENNQFILAESFEIDVSYAIICIKGYHSGCIEGYIKGPQNVSLSLVYLKSELENIFCEIHWDTFKVIKCINLNAPYKEE